ncbi:unnamed protein product [Nippostrongylus brasiliensis]|uniref:SERPIN domain-containing protein n=1 Tax=Nippostrongylus brasiliensis TaxID=27835 RepID=A0A0N4XTW0_NIPBR|nr:unnamed protein product [Nippostrongylus brasiliensis]
MEEANTFFREHCDYVRKAILSHGDSSITLTHTVGLDLDVTQRSDLVNAGIRFAREHSGQELQGRNVKAPVLVVTPAAFRNFKLVIIPEENVEVLLYSTLYDVLYILT